MYKSINPTQLKDIDHSYKQLNTTFYYFLLRIKLCKRKLFYTLINEQKDKFKKKSVRQLVENFR